MPAGRAGKATTIATDDRSEQLHHQTFRTKHGKPILLEGVNKTRGCITLQPYAMSVAPSQHKYLNGTDTKIVSAYG
jgi:hypothetical protein